MRAFICHINGKCLFSKTVPCIGNELLKKNKMWYHCIFKAVLPLCIGRTSGKSNKAGQTNPTITHFCSSIHEENVKWTEIIFWCESEKKDCLENHNFTKILQVINLQLAFKKSLDACFDTVDEIFRSVTAIILIMYSEHNRNTWQSPSVMCR